MSKRWTKEEESYLKESWGMISVPRLAENLDRSENAVIQRAQRIGLGAFLDSGDYITFNQLMIALKGHSSYSYQMTSWVKNQDFPIKYKKRNRNRFKVVYLEDFWKWADAHREMIDWSKIEENILGKEPDWVKEKRREHYQRNRKYKTTPWTKGEDSLLISLLKEQKYGCDEISKRMNRTVGAIQRRCCDLKTPYRPVKANNHNEWETEELEQLAQMINEHRSYEYMADVLRRSTKAIRGTVYRMYLTENVDKAAGILKGGKWGDNRPDRPITHKSLRHNERLQVKKDMTQFVRIIRVYAKLHYDYEDFWQKDMCQHWDGYCTKGQTNCDECTEFARIRPQYCVRCGSTFFERKENKLCTGCREARKKQAQRKWAIVNGKRVYRFE